MSIYDDQLLFLQASKEHLEINCFLIYEIPQNMEYLKKINPSKYM